MAQRAGIGKALLFHDHGTRRGERSAASPGRNLPHGKTQYPFYRRLGGPQGRSGRAENLVPTGIRSRTVQSVAQSLYRLSYRAHKFLRHITRNSINNCNFVLLVISVSGGLRYCLNRASKNLATPLVYSSSKKQTQQQQSYHDHTVTTSASFDFLMPLHN